jgi:hypothetical protein
MANLYGNYDLQFGDFDLNLKTNQRHYYDKKYRLAESGDLIPQSGELGYVEQLQKDLEELGFQLFPEGYKYGTFDEKTEWAVREFQIYAKMPKIAEQVERGDRYVDCLKQQNNTNRYKGLINGTVNQEARQLIELWKTNKWRCPVIVEAWYKQQNAEKPFNLKQVLPKKNQNIWLADAVTEDARMFVRDFTGYYDVPSEHSDFSQYYDLSKEDPERIEKLKQLIVIGAYSKSLKGGPVSLGAYHVWEPETEIRPETFIDSDKTYQTLNQSESSTYRVVRAVAEIECEGFFDVINAYDDAYISLGPCHWSLGKNELGGFLAYFQNKFPESFKKLVDFFGVRPSQYWNQVQEGNTKTGRSIFNPDQRLYNSSVSLQTEQSQTKNSNNSKYANYLKTWHWVYRFAMAGREGGNRTTDFRRCMWEFAVMRIRDILSTPIPQEWGIPNVSGRPAKIGDIYTSEKAVALLLRWHVYRPSQVIIRGQASQLEEGRFLFSVGVSDQLEAELNQGKVTANWLQKFNEANIQDVKIDDSVRKKTLNDSISLWRIKNYRVRKEDGQFNIYALPKLLDGCLRDAYQRAGSPQNSSNQTILIQGLIAEMSQANNNLESTASRVNKWPDWSRGIGDPSRLYRLGEEKKFEIDDLEQILEKELPQKNGGIKNSLSSKWREQFSKRGISLPQNNLNIINRSQRTWSILEMEKDLITNKFVIREELFVIRRQDQKLTIYQIVIERKKGLSEVDKSFQLNQAVSTNPIDLPLPAPTKPYGGYKLQFEDFDRQGTERFRYEKRLRTAERGEPIPTDENQGYVKQLQQHLIELGFLLVPAATGVFDQFTAYAVREFQIQARMSKIAQENIAAPSGTPYVDRLSAFNNTRLYLGDVTGVVNEATGELIKQWLQEKLRCPVVIQAWTMKDGKRDKSVKGKKNLWRLQDLTDETVQVFVRDFSGHYQAGIPSSRPADDWIELGQFFQTSPRSLNQLPENRHCWKESEVFPLNLLGKSPADLSPAERTLFSIFRAIGEAITGTGSCGYFDSIRTQPQHLPFFWLFGLRTTPQNLLDRSQEDLAAYLSYLRFAEPDSYTTAFGVFGLKPDRNWENEQGVGDGSSMLDISQRRYAAGIFLNTEEEEESVPIESEAFEYLSSWHWFYRWVMAARTVPGFQKGLWDYSRLQLQSILSTPWRDNALKVNQRRAVLKEVYTSVQVIALIYYWYLRFPEDIVDSGKVAESLVAAFQNAGISGNDPSAWTDADEKKLNDALIAKAKELRTEDDFVRGIDYISEWTQKRTDEATIRDYQLYNDTFGNSLALSQTRNSFSFDNSQIPPPSNKLAQKRVIRLSGVPDLSTFGVFALEEQSEDDLETYQVTAIVLTLASAASATETGLRIPLSEPVTLNLKLNEEPLPNQELSVLDPSQRTSQAIPVYEIAVDADLPPESTKWSLSLTELQNSDSALQFVADAVWSLTRSDDNLQRNAYLDIGFDANFIDNPPTWTFAAAASPLNPSANANQAQIVSFTQVDDGLTFTLTSLQQALTYALPLRLPPIPGDVLVQLVENQIRLRLQTQQEISLNLGSSLAQLKFKSAQLTLDSLDGLSLAIPPEATQGISLDLDIFSRAITDQKIINNLWSNVEEFTDAGEVLESLIRIKSETTSQLSEIEQLIVWRDRYPTIHKAVFDAFDKIVINSKRQLTSFAGDVLGKISPYQAFFENVAETIKPELIQEQGRWKLLMHLVMLVRENDQATPIIKAEGKFGFWAEADPTNPDTYLDIKSGAFVADEKISLTVLEDKVSSFGDLISLYIPKGSIFTFFTDPRQPSMTWQPSSDEQKTDARIAIRIPATEKPDLKESENGRFTFEMEKFAIGTAGFDLKEP